MTGIKNKGTILYSIFITIIAVILACHVLYVHQTYELFVDEDQKEVIDNFNEIALGAEYGGEKVIVKWNKPMKVFIETDSTYTKQIEFVKRTIKQINKIEPEFLKIEITEDKSQSNSHLVMCKYDNLKDISPLIANRIKENYCGYFTYDYKKHKIYRM